MNPVLEALLATARPPGLHMAVRHPTLWASADKLRHNLPGLGFEEP
jgi:hypothetical protein